MIEALLIVACFLAFIAWREREHREECRELAQRIQAPQRAVAAQARREEVAEPERRPRPVPAALEDDAAMTGAYDDEEDDDDGA